MNIFSILDNKHFSVMNNSHSSCLIANKEDGIQEFPSISYSTIEGDEIHCNAFILALMDKCFYIIEKNIQRSDYFA